MCVCLRVKNRNYMVRGCNFVHCLCVLYLEYIPEVTLYAAIIVNPAVLSVCVLCVCCISVLSSLPRYQLALQSSLSVIEQVAMCITSSYIIDGMTQKINKC